MQMADSIETRLLHVRKDRTDGGGDHRAAGSINVDAGAFSLAEYDTLFRVR